jgi:tRNA pseudouridine38-40 synthase
MQVAHYDAPVGREAGEILRGVNALLPSGVHIWGARAVEEAFHARFRAVQRTYAYRLLWAPSPFADRYGWHVPYAIDSERAVEASRIMIGTHDFSTFATRPDPDENPVCELRRIEWRAREDGAVLLVQADRFLRRMVRTLVGTLAEVGAGRRDPRSLEDLLAGREGRAGVPAPPQGLALLRVEYGDDEAGDEPPPSPWRMEA